MTLKSGKYRIENVAYILSTCLKRDYFRAINVNGKGKGALTERHAKTD